MWRSRHANRNVDAVVVDGYSNQVRAGGGQGVSGVWVARVFDPDIITRSQESSSDESQGPLESSGNDYRIRGALDPAGNRQIGGDRLAQWRVAERSGVRHHRADWKLARQSGRKP
jgi:hypothetical protein